MTFCSWRCFKLYEIDDSNGKGLGLKSLTKSDLVKPASASLAKLKSFTK